MPYGNSESRKKEKKREHDRGAEEHYRRSKHVLRLLVDTVFAVDVLSRSASEHAAAGKGTATVKTEACINTSEVPSSSIYAFASFARGFWTASWGRL